MRENKKYLVSQGENSCGCIGILKVFSIDSNVMHLIQLRNSIRLNEAKS